MGNQSIAVIVDDAAYGAAAAAFSQKVLNRLVKDLARHGLIDLKGDKDTVDIIYDLVFNLFAAFEDHGGFQDGEAGVSHLAFARHAISPPNLLVSWRRTFLHGGLDDPMILHAFEAARTAGAT